MRWKQRRKLGFTVRNLIKATKELKAAGELDGLGQSEISAAVLTKMIEGNTELLSDASFDWESILSFIERIMPLILKLIAIFGG